MREKLQKYHNKISRAKREALKETKARIKLRKKKALIGSAIFACLYVIYRIISYILSFVFFIILQIIIASCLNAKDVVFIYENFYTTQQHIDTVTTDKGSKEFTTNWSIYEDQETWNIYTELSKLNFEWTQKQLEFEALGNINVSCFNVVCNFLCENEFHIMVVIWVGVTVIGGVIYLLAPPWPKKKKTVYDL